MKSIKWYSNEFFIGVSVGILSSLTIVYISNSNKSKCNNNDNEADDSFQSLFYSKLNDEQIRAGCGFPNVKTIDNNEIQKVSKLMISIFLIFL